MLLQAHVQLTLGRRRSTHCLGHCRSWQREDVGGRITPWLLELPRRSGSRSLHQRIHLARTTICERTFNPPAGAVWGGAWWGRESGYFDSNTTYHSEYCLILQMRKLERWGAYPLVPVPTEVSCLIPKPMLSDHIVSVLERKNAHNIWLSTLQFTGRFHSCSCIWTWQLC